MSVTRKQLRDRAKRRADMENSAFVSDAEWNDFLDEEVSSLHDLLVLTYKDYAVEKVDISVVASTEAYVLPDDFYKERAVFYRDTNGNRFELERFNLFDIADNDPSLSLPSGTGDYLQYCIVGPKIYFSPEPTQSTTVELWYVPQAKRLKGDRSHVNQFHVMVGWEEFLILGAAVKALIKEESLEQAAALNNQKRELVGRVQAAAAVRHAGKPSRVRDVYKYRRGYPRRKRLY